MAIEYEKIFGWMPLVEGKLQTRGYVPCKIIGTDKTCNYRGSGFDIRRLDPFGVSGVTVGIGVDLGQQTEHQLRKWGVGDELMVKIRPYIGRKDRDACEALEALPLTLTEEEAKFLTYAEQRGYMDEVVQPTWDFQYGKRGKFCDLPWQAQCVIFSLVYQLGWGGLRKRGKFTLAALEAHDWPRAIANLQSGAKGWDGEYYERRYMEGTLLKGAL